MTLLDTATTIMKRQGEDDLMTWYENLSEDERKILLEQCSIIAQKLSITFNEIVNIVNNFMKGFVIYFRQAGLFLEEDPRKTKARLKYQRRYERIGKAKNRK